MAIERLRRSMFDTLVLPPLQETYRKSVIHQLYANILPVYNTSCWATGCANKHIEHAGKIVMLPGEEAFLMNNKNIIFDPQNPAGITCPHASRDVFIKQNDVNDAMQNEGVEHVIKNIYRCKLGPHDRPIMCRIWPFKIKRDASNNRCVVIQCDRRGIKSIASKYGNNFIDQKIHDIAQISISMWPFLDERWWNYYESCMSKEWQHVDICSINFTLNDDVIISNIKNAPHEWRVEMLAMMADASCQYCTGGIEFWDRDIVTGNMFPVKNRRFDVCRHCVLPKIGLIVDGMLVDPSNRRVLDQYGNEYRGDVILKKDV